MKIRFFSYALIFSLSITTLLVMTGCATEGVGSRDYSRAQTRGEQKVRMGIVESVRTVKIEGTRTGGGALAGAGLGGLAASQIGRGKGSTAAAIGGAILGGLAGQAIEQGITKQEGYEITVKLNDGEIIAVTQGADEQFYVGDRVRVLGYGNTTRVSH